MTTTAYVGVNGIAPGPIVSVFMDDATHTWITNMISIRLQLRVLSGSWVRI